MADPVPNPATPGYEPVPRQPERRGFFDLSRRVKFESERPRMVWRGDWSPANNPYSENDVVRDDGWTMVCTEPDGCTERPSPQPTGDPFYVYPGVSTPTSSLVDERLLWGQEYTFGDQGGYVSGLRLYTVTGQTYEVWTYDPVTSALSVFLPSFTSLITGWREFPVVPRIVAPGVQFSLLVANGPPPQTPVETLADYNYRTPNNQPTVPPTGDILHRGQSTGELRIHKTDDNGTDRSAVLTDLEAGDEISGAGTLWTVTDNAIDNGTWVTVPVSPQTQGSPTGVQEFTFRQFPPASITYFDDAGYWLANPPASGTIRGLFSADGLANIVYDDTQYGVDLLVQAGDFPEEWSVVAAPEGGGAASTINHSALQGLDADDHTQYWNDARGDAKIATHAAATDPHGDRAYADATFVELAGDTMTGDLILLGGTNDQSLQLQNSENANVALKWQWGGGANTIYLLPTDKGDGSDQALRSLNYSFLNEFWTFLGRLDVNGTLYANNGIISGGAITIPAGDLTLQAGQISVRGNFNQIASSIESGNTVAHEMIAYHDANAWWLLPLDDGTYLWVDRFYFDYGNDRWTFNDDLLVANGLTIAAGGLNATGNNTILTDSFKLARVNDTAHSWLPYTDGKFYFSAPEHMFRTQTYGSLFQITPTLNRSYVNFQVDGDIIGLLDHVVRALNAWQPGDPQLNNGEILVTDFIITRHIAAGAVTTDELNANSVTADKISVGARDVRNLVINSRFVDGEAGWVGGTAGADWEVVADASAPAGGNNVGRIKPNDANNTVNAFCHPVEPGATYRVGTWLRENASSGTTIIAVYHNEEGDLNENGIIDWNEGTDFAQSILMNRAARSDDVWVWWEYEWTAPANKKWAQVVFAWQGTGLTGDVRHDGAVFQQQMVSEIELGDGLITTPKLATDAIQSQNYDGPDAGEVFSDAGSFLDLDDGVFTSVHFVADASGVKANAFQVIDDDNDVALDFQTDLGTGGLGSQIGFADSSFANYSVIEGHRTTHEGVRILSLEPTSPFNASALRVAFDNVYAQNIVGNATAVGEVPLVPTNWTELTAAAGWAKTHLRWRRDGDDIVLAVEVAGSGTSVNGTAIATAALPVGSRPPAQVRFPAWADGTSPVTGSPSIYVDTSGWIRLYGCAGASAAGFGEQRFALT